MANPVFDPRGFPTPYGGPIARTGTVGNPSGAAGVAAVGQPYATNRIGNGSTVGVVPPPQTRNAAHYGNRPPGMGSRAWGQQVAPTFPGGAGGGGGATPGGTAGGLPGTGGISTGISSTITPQQVAQARMRMLRAAGVPLTPGQAGELGGHYGDVARGLLDADDTDLQRWGAFEQHGLQSDMEQARANAGVMWGNVGARMNELDINEILGQGDLFGNQMRLVQSLMNSQN